MKASTSPFFAPNLLIASSPPFEVVVILNCKEHLSGGKGLMDRESVLMILSQHRQYLLGYGVKDIRLFGSVARGEAGPGSDAEVSHLKS
jgi:hypothetical protein